MQYVCCFVSNVFFGYTGFSVNSVVYCPVLYVSLRSEIKNPKKLNIACIILNFF